MWRRPRGRSRIGACRRRARFRRSPETPLDDCAGTASLSKFRRSFLSVVAALQFVGERRDFLGGGGEILRAARLLARRGAGPARLSAVEPEAAPHPRAYFRAALLPRGHVGLEHRDRRRDRLAFLQLEG